MKYTDIIFKETYQSFINSPHTASEKLSDTENSVVYEVVLPRYKKDEIKISVETDVLNITATKLDDKKNTVKSFYRCYTIPSFLDTNNIKAKLEDGVLTVILPKLPSAIIKNVVVE